MTRNGSTTFDIVDIIRKKRASRELSDAEIDWLIGGYLADEIADEQMSALLMAICLRDMSRAELGAWTRSMIASGETMDLSSIRLPIVDKHSTGGVGDKVTLVLAPLIAACGAAVPQLSGRGLGHSGGTLDKLEAIPGFRTTLSPGEMLAQLDEVGCVVCAPGAGLVPADRKLYALRDVTGTVESIPLTAASIMSKKIAEGTTSLVLDVTVGSGSGASMKDRDRAVELAQSMIALGREHGVPTVVLLTAMDEPLGRAVGNGLEVEEAIATLKGAGPADLLEVTLALAKEMLDLAGLSGRDPVRALADGSALDRFRAMVIAQGGDPDAQLAQAPFVEMVLADRAGFVRRLDALSVGVASWRLGAGRARKEDSVSASAGVLCHAKPGDYVEAGEPVLEMRTETKDRFARARGALEGAIEIGDEPPVAQSLILDRIT